MIRRVLVLAGGATAGYGAALLLPQFRAALPWLAGGPLIHDLVVAPLIGGLGALAGRRRAVAAALAVTGTLLLLAVPPLWRPHPASPNPGLVDRDYPIGLAVFLGVVWALAGLVRALAALAALRPRHLRGVRGRADRRADRRAFPTVPRRSDFCDPSDT